MTARRVPSTLAILGILVRVTLRRMIRGRAVWVSALIAALPTVFAIIESGKPEIVSSMFFIELLAACLLPPMFVASAIGEELEDRTMTYLWSRPLARWTVLIGKVLALAPVAIALLLGGWIAAMELGTHTMPSLQSLVALAAGGLALAMVAAGIATLVPKYGMALTIVYVMFVDLPLGEIPASLQSLSVTHQIKLLAMGDAISMVSPAVTMATIAWTWFGLGLWRVRRLEA